MEAKLIHIGRISGNNTLPHYLFLRELAPSRYVWFNKDQETPIWGPTTEEAMRLAFKQWKGDSFRPVNCGFRYTLPERDEHGSSALFYQMVASYSSMNGIYFDEEVGCNCIVHNASQEARSLWNSLK